MQQRNKLALGIFAVFYITLGAYLTLNQERIIYLPQPGPDFEQCTIAPGAKRVTHNDTRMFVRDTGLPLVVFYHGNADSVCRLTFLANFITEANHNYVFVEYAGYSGDTRQPAHSLIKQDVENVVDYLRKQNRPAAVVMGQSVGTGAAALHASHTSPEKLLLLSPFTDLAAAAADRFWFYPTRLLVDNAFDNVSALANYQGHTLIIHGAADPFMPPEFATELYDSLAGEKTLLIVEGVGHNDLFSSSQTITAITTFLEQE